MSAVGAGALPVRRDHRLLAALRAPLPRARVGVLGAELAELQLGDHRRVQDLGREEAHGSSVSSAISAVLSGLDRFIFIMLLLPIKINDLSPARIYKGYGIDVKVYL